MLARTEAEAPYGARVSAERTRIVPSVGPRDGERSAEAGISSRKEYGVSVRITHYLVTIVTALSCPRPSAVISEFLKFVFRRHTPTATPIHVGSIIGEIEDGLVIYRTPARVRNVFRETITRVVVAVLQRTPRIIALCRCLAPGEVVRRSLQVRRHLRYRLPIIL